MRILYVSPYLPARDGVANYTSVLVAAMRARGHDAGVVVPRPAPTGPDDVIGALGRRPGRDAALRQSVSRFGPDVVHIQFSVGAFGSRTPALLRSIAVLKRDHGVPVLVTMHEVTRDTALLRSAGRALYRAVAGRCDRVIVHTRAAKTALTGFAQVPAAKVTVIPHPTSQPPAGDVDASELRRKFSLSGARILLAFGFVHVDKGLQDLVRALGLLRRQGTLPAGTRLVVAGAVRRRSGPMRVFEAWDHLYLQRALWLARLHGVRGDIVLTGYVRDAEVAGWFGAAECAVLPYRRIEQSGVVSLALALGVPVLASRVGGLDELFPGSPWTFPPRDPARLAETIIKFLRTPRDSTVAPGVVPRAGTDVAAVAAATLDAYAVLSQGSAGGLARAG
jgi:glycosyltransferase involved in cell wall biosynthesis